LKIVFVAIHKNEREHIPSLHRNKYYKDCI